MNEMAFRVTSNDGTTIAYDGKEAVRLSFLVAAPRRGVENAPWRQLSPSTSRSTTMPSGTRRRAASPSPTPWKGDRGPGCVDRGGGRLGTPVRGVLRRALALEAAAAGSAIDTIAVWEVPYAVGDDIRPRFEEYIADTDAPSTPGETRRFSNCSCA